MGVEKASSKVEISVHTTKWHGQYGFPLAHPKDLLYKLMGTRIFLYTTERGPVQ